MVEMVLSSKQRSASRRCPICSQRPPDSEEGALDHFAEHAAEGKVAVVEGPEADWYVDVRNGAAVWRAPVARPDDGRKPFSIPVSRFPTRQIAAQSILVALVPALVAALSFWQLTRDQPFLPFAAAPCAFIIVLRGVRRMSARVFARRRLERAPGALFAGRLTPANTVAAGQWLGLDNDSASRVIAVEPKDDGCVRLVFSNGATVRYDADTKVLVGAVVAAGPSVGQTAPSTHDE